MHRSTCISALCLAIAIWNYATHRDISGNMFLVALFIIQACRHIPEEKPSRQWDHVNLLCIILAAAIFLFAVYGHFSDLQWKSPKSW